MNYLDKLKDPRWQKKRLQVFKRDKFTCVNCGEKSKTLHVHHIAYGKEPWSVPLKMLITLCEDCHKQEELDLKQYKESLFKDLRSVGFNSMAFSNLSSVFQKDRGWADFDPSWDILKMVINDDKLWQSMYDLFFDRLMNKNG